MKNPQRIAERKAAAQRQEQYLEETTEPDGKRTAHKPKFLKWLRGKVGGNATERALLKVERKVGAPRQRVQRRVSQTRQAQVGKPKAQTSQVIVVRAPGESFLDCGRCAEDRGVNQKLVGPYVNAKGESTYVCGYCQAERQPNGSHLRVHVIGGGKDAGKETVSHIPHIARVQAA